METLYHESEIFEVLYNLSVGVERLLKVAVILIEHEDSAHQNTFEKSLITHSHSNLMQRVQKRHNLGLTAPYNEFLNILSTFYKTARYGRYTLDADHSAERSLLHHYIEKSLEIKVLDNTPVAITPNDKRIRKLVGKRVGKIVTGVYRVIEHEASRLGIYTYEIRSDSKAYKIFVRQRFDFNDEDVLWKELLIYFLNAQKQSQIIKFMKTIDPLPFDPELVNEYLQCFGSQEKQLSVLDELESAYEDLVDTKSRLAKLDVIGNSAVCFDEESLDDT